MHETYRKRIGRLSTFFNDFEFCSQQSPSSGCNSAKIKELIPAHYGKALAYTQSTSHISSLR